RPKALAGSPISELQSRRAINGAVRSPQARTGLAGLRRSLVRTTIPQLFSTANAALHPADGPFPVSISSTQDEAAAGDDGEGEARRRIRLSRNPPFLPRPQCGITPSAKQPYANSTRSLTRRTRSGLLRRSPRQTD